MKVQHLCTFFFNFLIALTSNSIACECTQFSIYTLPSEDKSLKHTIEGFVNLISNTTFTYGEFTISLEAEFTTEAYKLDPKNEKRRNCTTNARVLLLKMIDDKIPGSYFAKENGKFRFSRCEVYITILFCYALKVTKTKEINYFSKHIDRKLPSSFGNSFYHCGMKFVSGSRNSIFRDSHKLKLRKTSVQMLKMTVVRISLALKNFHFTAWNFGDDLTNMRYFESLISPRGICITHYIKASIDNKTIFLLNSKTRKRQKKLSNASLKAMNKFNFVPSYPPSWRENRHILADIHSETGFFDIL